MNRPNFRPWLRALVALMLVASLRGQTAPTTSSASPSSARGEEPVVLSPFQVGSESDRGYMSTAILQGGRGKIDHRRRVCEFLLQALERLDDEIASGAPVVELRRFADEARAELERRRLNPMES